MPRALDLSKLSPERRESVLRRREQKRDEYRRRKTVLLARSKAWQAANPDKVLALRRVWEAANQERKRDNTARWYQEHRAEVLARQAVRDRELSTPGAIRAQALTSAEREMGMSARDVPDEMLVSIRLTKLIKRELKQRKQVAT